MMARKPIYSAWLDRSLLGAALGDPAPWSIWLAILRDSVRFADDRR
jgi:hypothetical protein